MPEFGSTCNRLHNYMDFNSQVSESRVGAPWYPYLVPHPIGDMSLDTAFKTWSITSDGRLKHNSPEGGDAVPCPSASSTGGTTTAVKYDMLMAAGSATTYRHETGRELTVEAKFIIPEGSNAALALRRDTGGFNGYKIELTGGETRDHFFTERAYGFIDGSWGYYDNQLGNFKAGCTIPTDSTSEPKHIKVVQSTTSINVYCGDVLVYEYKTTWFDTFGM